MIVLYTSTGFVQQTIQEPVDNDYAARVASLGLSIIRVPNDHFGDKTLLDFYYNATSKSVIRRPSFPGVLNKTSIVANGIDEARLTSIPAGVSVTVDGTSYAITDGVFAISTDMPGDYVLSVDQFPYLPWSAIVKARI